MYFHALERLLTEMTGSPHLDHEHGLLEHVFVKLVDALTNPCFSAQASLRLFKEVVENLNFDTQFLSVEAQQACLMVFSQSYGQLSVTERVKDSLETHKSSDIGS